MFLSSQSSVRSSLFLWRFSRFGNCIRWLRGFFFSFALCQVWAAVYLIISLLGFCFHTTFFSVRAGWEGGERLNFSPVCFLCSAYKNQFYWAVEAARIFKWSIEVKEDFELVWIIFFSPSVFPFSEDCSSGWGCTSTEATQSRWLRSSQWMKAPFSLAEGIF